jgi:O-acetyl-ADP-ribose deacetylase
MHWQIHSALLEIVQDDITEREETAIVNPANSDLVLGGGVAGAIRRKGGPAIQAECRRKAPVPVGEAVVTTGGDLKAGFVIHAVGPRWGDGEEDEKLRSAVYRSLRVADQNGFPSLALPAISTGIFGFPVRRAAEIILDTVVRYLRIQTPLRKVVLVLYDRETLDIFTGIAEGMEAAGLLPVRPSTPGD